MFLNKFYKVNASRFQKASVNFYLISLLAYTIGSPFNMIEYVHRSYIDFIILDLTGFVIIYTAFIHYLKGRINIRQNSTIYVYTLLTNLSVSMWLYNWHDFDVTGNLLLNTFMYSINMAVAGFCISRKHSFYTAAMFAAVIGPLLFTTSSGYIRQYAAFILFLMVAYSVALAEFLKILERTFDTELAYKEEIFNKDKALNEEHEKMLNYELQCRQKEIMAKTMFLLEYAEKNNDFIKKLNTLKPHLAAPKQRTLEEIIDLHRIDHHESYWKEFEARFIEIYPEFYKNLIAICPDLSPAEYKLATLVHLGLSSKQIAALTNNTPESIDVARSRFRRKLNLPNATNLMSYLRDI
jgi:DNA-binding CsgD family transcriptional regulator